MGLGLGLCAAAQSLHAHCCLTLAGDCLCIGLRFGLGYVYGLGDLACADGPRNR